MVKSSSGHVSDSFCRTVRGSLSSGSNLVTAKFLLYLPFLRVTDAIPGARSCVWCLFQRHAMAYKEANPQMFVRIFALPTARVMNTNNSRCYPWEDKKQ